MTEPFAPYAMPDNYEKILGNLATTIQSPAQWDIPANSATNPNPTGLIATYSNPLDPSTLTNIQNIYSTALGNPNAGPRMDDNNSFLYMVDFCYQKGKDTNPFSDTTFSRNCGMCMTTGTLLNGTGMPGSNGLGVVVYQADKDYSLSQGIDAVPSSHSATCAPLVKLAGISSNVTSLAINAQQLNETRTYLQSNSYTISAGTGAGQTTLTCTGTSNGHPYVIKAGASRAGAWDTHIAGAPIDYTRKNLLTTVPFPGTCTEERSCTVTSQLQQWDMSAVCGYPKPTPITNLTVDTSQTTATSLKFVWGGGLYADTYDYNLLNLTASLAVPGNKATLSSATKSVAYTGLTANTQYKFTLTIRNSAGIAEGSYITGSASGFTNYEEGFTGSVIGATLDDRDPIILEDASEITTTGFRINWRGGNNAQIVELCVSEPDGSIQCVRIYSPTTNSYLLRGLTASTQYTFWITSSYDTEGTLTTGSRTVTTASPSPRTTNQLITSAQWLGGSEPVIRLSWTPAAPSIASGTLKQYRIYVSPNSSTTATQENLTNDANLTYIQYPSTTVTTTDIAIAFDTNKAKYITIWPDFEFGLQTAPFFLISGSPPPPPVADAVALAAAPDAESTEFSSWPTNITDTGFRVNWKNRPFSVNEMKAKVTNLRTLDMRDYTVFSGGYVNGGYDITGLDPGTSYRYTLWDLGQNTGFKEFTTIVANPPSAARTAASIDYDNSDAYDDSPPVPGRIITSAIWTTGTNKRAIDVTWTAAPRSTAMGELARYVIMGSPSTYATNASTQRVGYASADATSVSNYDYNVVVRSPYIVVGVHPSVTHLTVWPQYRSAAGRLNYTRYSEFIPVVSSAEDVRAAQQVEWEQRNDCYPGYIRGQVINNGGGFVATTAAARYVDADFIRIIESEGTPYYNIPGSYSCAVPAFRKTLDDCDSDPVCNEAAAERAAVARLAAAADAAAWREQEAVRGREAAAAAAEAHTAAWRSWALARGAIW